MEPIINPLWFYLIDVLGSFRTVILFIGIVLLFIIIAGAYLTLYPKEFKDWLKSKQFEKLLILGVLLVIIGVLFPCQETAYKMLIASLITPDNIAATGGAVQDIVDYIINSVNELLNQ